MSSSHNFYLVALSIAVAIQASYVGLSLALRIPGAFALNRRLPIAGSAITLAVGIWSMHFIGMLSMG
ncbi:MAG: LytTR family transcriptional regulator, partial [Hoeflea sp.]|nr:LytTR family transcriptional regulator [Hoeflea sp.]